MLPGSIPIPFLPVELLLDCGGRCFSAPLAEDAVREIDCGPLHFRWEWRMDGEMLTSRLTALSGEGPIHTALKIAVPGWDLAHYLLLPAAVYGGNRVLIADDRSVYPPRLAPDFRASDPPQLTGVIKHFSPEGGGRMEGMAGEFAFPCCGVWSPADRSALWVLSAQGNELGDYGYSVTEAPGAKALEFVVSSPVRRKMRQQGCSRLVPAEDPPAVIHAGESVTVTLRIVRRPCADMPAFFRQTREFRNSMVPAGTLPDLYPCSDAVRAVAEKHERSNWLEPFGYYTTVEISKISPCSVPLQLGWVGGGMETEYFLAAGTPVMQEHARRNLDFIFRYGQCKSGFFLTNCRENVFSPDRLVRKNADLLHALVRQLILLKKRGENVPKSWENGTLRFAEAFVRFYDRYGQFGYALEPETGELTVGGGAGGAAASSGLALAAGYFRMPDFLDTARRSVLDMTDRYLYMGNVYGAAGDTIQATDSESAYALLEALMTVWEHTGEPEMLVKARFAADYLATWCVAYDYQFPAGSCFGRLDMKSCGAVYANIQNRHAAPGFCSASGEALFKLYRATGDAFYGELLRQTVHAIPQFLSRRGRLIRNLDADCINERVNLADWEGMDHIGEVFNHGTWPEVSLLLARIQVPGIYVRTDTGSVLVTDHVRAVLHGAELELTNPTGTDADITLLAETAAQAALPWKSGSFDRFRQITVPAHGSRTVLL